MTKLAVQIPWSGRETQDSVTVVSGQFNVLLGSVSPLSVNNFNGDRYLGIQMSGELEMEQRMRLVSVVSSLQGEQANSAYVLDAMDDVAAFILQAKADMSTGRNSSSYIYLSPNEISDFIPIKMPNKFYTLLSAKAAGGGDLTWSIQIVGYFQ